MDKTQLQDILDNLPPYIHYDEKEDRLYNSNTKQYEAMDGDIIAFLDYDCDGSGNISMHKEKVKGYTDCQIIPTKTNGTKVIQADFVPTKHIVGEAIDKEMMVKLKEYASANKNKVFALNNWINLNMKPFKLTDALACVYDYANGNGNKMNDIIEHLTAKRKVYGRTQVYADDNVGKMDIVVDNGKLVLKGYDRNNELPLKGQKQTKNPNIFRKSDNQTKKTYQNTEKKIYDIGKAVRDMWPTASKTYIALAIVAIRKYAQEKKINTDKVVGGLQKGRLFLDDDSFVIKSNNNEQKVIIIDENMAQIIAEELQMSEYKFNNAIKAFLHDLLIDPVNAKPSLVLTAYGYNRTKLLRYLINYGIVEKEEKINDTDENGKLKTATMKIKFKVPKKNFERKLKRLYIRLFEKNVPNLNKEIVSEDGEMGGATGSDSSGQYSQPVFGVQRREIYNVEEATATSTTGDYQYTVPFPGDKETLKRKNGVGGSVSVNKM